MLGLYGAIVMKPASRLCLGSALVALFATIPATAEACIDIAPFVVDDIRKADVVLTGKLIDYEIIDGPKEYSLNKYGLLTFRVEGVFKGKVARDVQLYWWNSTFNMPEQMDEGKRMIIAAVDTGKPLPLRSGSAYVQGSMRPDLLNVLQAPCSAPFIFPYTETTVVNVASVLRGENPGKYDYFRSSQKQAKRTRGETGRELKWRVVAFVLALSLSVYGLIQVLRRRKRLALDPKGNSRS